MHTNNQEVFKGIKADILLKKKIFYHTYIPITRKSSQALKLISYLGIGVHTQTS